jgi:hypothetical protein
LDNIFELDQVQIRTRLKEVCSAEMDIAYKSLLIGDGIVWCDRQDDAREELIRKGGDHGIFVLQKFNGRRRFCVANHQTFMRKYYEIHPQFRHFYEVVPSGAPCRLYFDIEFKTAENADVDGLIAVDTLIDYINHSVQIEYDIKCDRRHVIQLESSTEERFSQHLIYHLPGALFQDNQHCKRFVRKIMASAREALTGMSDKYTKDYPCNKLVSMFIQSKGNPSSTLVDLLVYNNNQHFRLLHSSKLARESRLFVSDESCYPLPTGPVLLETLICPSQHEVDTSKMLTFEIEENLKIWTESRCEVALCKSATSRYPQLDQFVRNFLQSDPNYKGSSISSLREYSNEKSITYFINNSRYCSNVGRQHSSNRIFFVASLLHRELYQMCYSKQCGGYRSASVPIPADALKAAM